MNESRLDPRREILSSSRRGGQTEDCDNTEDGDGDNTDDIGDNTGATLATIWGASAKGIPKMMPEEHEGDNDSMSLSFLMMVLANFLLPL